MRVPSLIRLACGLLLLASASAGFTSCKEDCPRPKSRGGDCHHPTASDSTGTGKVN